MPIVTKQRPTPDQMYLRLAAFTQLFPWAFRKPPTGKHAAGRDPKPLLLEGYGHRIGMTGMLPTRTESTRGERKRALQALCDLQVACERKQREHLAAVARGEAEPREPDAFVADKEASPRYKWAMRVLHPEAE